MCAKRGQRGIPDSILISPRRSRQVIPFVVIALLAGGVICDRSAQPPQRGDDQARYHDRSFRVVHVVDGDTLDINAPDADKAVTRIRLWGVDTPEVGRGGESSMHFGPEASEFARKTLEGRTVHVVLSPERTRGKYGRLLAYVYLERGGRMFNEMLLEEGYAYADLRFEHHYYKQFKDIEKRSRKANRGLWGDITVEKMPEWKQRFEDRKKD
ncbi:MAG: thermonuclease family protein [Phycisphaerales bacterium]|nr:MAG: thermonuclease family protein [Phycisphaerales bacterium]